MRLRGCSIDVFRVGRNYTLGTRRVSEPNVRLHVLEQPVEDLPINRAKSINFLHSLPVRKIGGYYKRIKTTVANSFFFYRVTQREQNCVNANLHLVARKLNDTEQYSEKYRR